jgi:hypothetical protein
VYFDVCPLATQGTVRQHSHPTKIRNVMTAFIVDRVNEWVQHINALYLLTPSSRVLLENLRAFQLVKKFPAFYGNRKFITAVTRARHLSLSYPLTVSQHVTFLWWGVFSTSPNPPSCKTTRFRLYETAFPICSQLLSTLEAVPPSATWGRAMARWHGPTDHGNGRYSCVKYIVLCVTPAKGV